MFASRSLFQTAIPIGNPPQQGETGIKKTSPFLNNWANSQAATAPLADYPDKKKSGSRQQKRYSSSNSNSKSKGKMAGVTDIYGFVPKDSKSTPYPLSQHRGRVLLIVNVASKCGFTPQYTALEALYKKYHPRGLDILAFPCNQFMNQEAGTADQIQEFCRLTYGVTFPVLAKVEVNGEAEEPLYAFLKNEKKSLGMKKIKWNFEKFLVDRRGDVVDRYASTTKPESLEGAIERELAVEVPEGSAGGGVEAAKSEL